MRPKDAARRPRGKTYEYTPPTEYVDRLRDVSRRTPTGSVLLASLVERVRKVQGRHRQPSADIERSIRARFRVINRDGRDIVMGVALTPRSEAEEPE